jgi:nucleotide-binding universal stress UspA family protein
MAFKTILTLASVDQGNDDVLAAAATAEQLGAHLIALVTAALPLPPGGREPGQVLQQHAKDVGAELVVMGAYGHSRLQERIFGGTTQWTIENADIPVLMSR